MSSRRIPCSASAGTTSSRKQCACASIAGSTCLAIASRVSLGVQPSEPRLIIPASTCSRRPDTRTMKNSSRLVAKIARKRSRSSSGVAGSCAIASTRSLNCNQEISRLRYSDGSVSSRLGWSAASPVAAAAATAPFRSLITHFAPHLVCLLMVPCRHPQGKTSVRQVTRCSPRHPPWCAVGQPYACGVVSDREITADLRLQRQERWARQRRRRRKVGAMGGRRRVLGMVGFVVVVVVVAAACGGGKKSTPGAATAAPQRGGVYRTAVDDLGLTNGFDPTGEYVAIAFNSYNAILRTLVATRHIAAPAGNVLYPDLAAKYGFYYDGIIKGMDGSAPKPAPVSGIDTPNDQTIVFHLTHPVGDFLYRLAMPATAPAPKEVAGCFTKAGDYGRYVIASGPYMIQGSDKLDASSCQSLKPISGFDPTKKLVLVRNPDYSQSTDTLRSNWVDGIQIQIDTNLSDIFSRIERGELDGSLANQLPKTALARYLTDPAKRQYVHTDPGDDTWYITMNLAHPPFDDLHVRKAVNEVIDKAAVLQAWGGPQFGQIATHVIPPTMLSGQLGQSYDPYASSGFHGDLAKAKDEMKQSRYDANKDGVCDAPACRNLVMVSRNVAPFTDMEPIITQDLAKIGIGVFARAYTTGNAYRTIQSVKTNTPLALHAQWIKDYADPYTFANPLFGSGSIIPEGNVNYSLVGLTPSMASKLGIDFPSVAAIPSVDSDINGCEQIPAGDPSRISCWSSFDKKLMEQVVPWVPYLWGDNITITAPSVTQYVFDQSSSYISLTQLAVNNKVSVSSLG